MTQEEKELLLEDLCTRLPYGVVLKVDYIINNETTDGEDVPATCDDKLLRINFDDFSVYTGWLWEYSDIDNVKPYLRSMSSMTEEEHNIIHDLLDCFNPKNELWMLTDFLSKRMLDYRGLIEKGLALEAPEGLYNF